MIVVRHSELEFDGVDVLGHLEDMDALSRYRLKSVLEQLFETQAVRDDEIGVAHSLAVSQRRLIAVRVSALRDECGHRSAAVAGHIAHHVCPDAGGDDHRGHGRRCFRRNSVAIGRARLVAGVGARARRGQQQRSSRHDEPPARHRTVPSGRGRAAPAACGSFDLHSGSPMLRGRRGRVPRVFCPRRGFENENQYQLLYPVARVPTLSGSKRGTPCSISTTSVSRSGHAMCSKPAT